MAAVLGTLFCLQLAMTKIPSTSAFADEREAHPFPTPQPLHVLVLSPHPGEQVSWTGGPALFSAAQLAADKINNRTDILPGFMIQLIDGDSGCNIVTKAIETFARERHQHRNTGIVGILGPACSAAAEPIGGLTERPDLSVSTVSITIATGPQLKDKYSNMFRALSSSTLYGEVILQLMRRNGWRKVAAIYHMHQLFFKTLFTNFSRSVPPDYELLPVAAVSGAQMYPLNYIHSRANVVIVFANSKYTKNLLCFALKSKWRLVFPNYQWIFLDSHKSALLNRVHFFHTHEGRNYTCTCEEMTVAVNKTIILRSNLQRENKTESTDVGLTYNEFYDEYIHYFNNYLSQNNISSGEVTQDASDWAATYFDSMWALGLALNKSINIIKHRNKTLQDYLNGTPHISSLLREQLLHYTKFKGLSGEFYFHADTLEVPSVIDIFQVHPQLIGIDFRIGYYYDGNLYITDEDNVSFVSPIRMEMKTVSTAAVAVFVALALLIFSLTVLLHGVYVVYYRSKSIKAQSPHFSNFIFSGCYLLIIAAVLETIRAANWTREELNSASFKIILGTLCNIVMWCFTLGSCLIFATVCALSWRVYRIFQKFNNPGRFISDPFLVLIIVVMVAVNCIVLVAWASTDPLLLHMRVGNEGIDTGKITVYCYCDCKYFSRWLLMWGWNGVVIVCVVIFALLNRNIRKKDFKNTHAHSVMVYAISLLNGICIPLYFFHLNNADIDFDYVLFEFFTLGSVLLSGLFLFVPPLIPLLLHTFILKTHRIHTKINVK